ncbi:transcription termination factor Rho [Pseudonocardia sp. N23]|uniref:transcription termination factor Rho n=1 Tax=Pseudonocardia sp. N23 TaxID=1987376 RepID=UPI000BFCE361|nr:transcription termination factor Rho [Pseudonocardia sp. N23]GAY12425.1 transcription termination factor Rho [Pseudonocardia sp. N23]
MSETDLVSTAAPAKRKGLSGMVLAELRQLAGELNISGTAGMRKGDLIAAIKERQGGVPAADASPQLTLGDSAPGNGSARAASSAPAEAPAAPDVAPAAEVAVPVADAAPVAPVRGRRRAASRPAGAPSRTAADAAPAGDTAPAADAVQATDAAPTTGATTDAPAAAGSPAADAVAAAATTDTPVEAPAAPAAEPAAAAETAATAPSTNGSAVAADTATEAPAETTGRRRQTRRRGGDQVDAEAEARTDTRPETDGGSRRSREDGNDRRGNDRGNDRNTDRGDRSGEDRESGRGDRGGRNQRGGNDRANDQRGDRAGDQRGERAGDQRGERANDRGNDQRGERASDQREIQRGRNDPRDGSDQRDNRDSRDVNRDNRDDDGDDDGDGRGRRGRRFRDRRRGRDRTTGGQNNVDTEVRDDDVLLPVAGIVDILDNYAFVRTTGYLSGPNDVYVSLSMVRKYGLRRGDAITGAVRQPRDGEQQRQKFNPLVRVDTVNGRDPETAKARPEFTKLTPLYPNERLRLETEPSKLTTRVIDLVMPVGKGQRALIVSPPKAGKTMVLQSIANAITTNNPEVHLMVVLVDERPEEVTDMQRSVKGEVIASTFDRPPSDHTAVAELAIERAKRLVEMGHDVVVLLDSITRLGRAYNLAAPASGRILSGGVDSTALYPPKRFLGAARNIEDGGSLTIFATALVETGSTMDTVIFEEFKGTGNAELKLDRKIADKRVFPAIDVDASGTRKEELLMSPDEFAVTVKLRRVLSALDDQQAIDLVLDRLRKTRTNIEFLMTVAKSTPGNDND